MFFLAVDCETKHKEQSMLIDSQSRHDQIRDKRPLINIRRNTNLKANKRIKKPIRNIRLDSIRAEQISLVFHRSCRINSVNVCSDILPSCQCVCWWFLSLARLIAFVHLCSLVLFWSDVFFYSIRSFSSPTTNLALLPPSSSLLLLLLRLWLCLSLSLAWRSSFANEGIGIELIRSLSRSKRTLYLLESFRAIVLRTIVDCF